MPAIVAMPVSGHRHGSDGRMSRYESPGNWQTAAMTLLFDGELHVDYSQFYVESRTDEDAFDIPDVLKGQVNGLCGAAVPGMLFLSTGLHTGDVKVTVELLDAPPPVGEDWEDVVEVSFRPQAEVRLMRWAGEQSWPLALEPTDYRVRYCASGMDASSAEDTRADGEPLVDRYLLQLWPASPTTDVIVRQTSEKAVTWHGYARKLRTEQRRERPAQEAGGPPAWGAFTSVGRLPWMIEVMAWLDRDLTAGIERSDENTRRAVAIWAARRACGEAGLSDLDWVTAALDALKHGEPLPAPLDDSRTATRQLQRDPRVRLTTVDAYDGRQQVPQQPMAVLALSSAATADPRESLFYAIVTFGAGYPGLLAELRQAFPALSTS